MKTIDSVLDKIISICEVCNKQYSSKDAKMVNKLMTMHLLRIHKTISLGRTVNNYQYDKKCMTENETKKIIDKLILSHI